MNVAYGGVSRGNRRKAYLVGCDVGEFGAEEAGLDHAVGVAEGGDGDFDEEIIRFEMTGRRHLVDLVGSAIYVLSAPWVIGWVRGRVGRVSTFDYLTCKHGVWDAVNPHV